MSFRGTFTKDLAHLLSAAADEENGKKVLLNPRKEDLKAFVEYVLGNPKYDPRLHPKQSPRGQDLDAAKALLDRFGRKLAEWRCFREARPLPRARSPTRARAPPRPSSTTTPPHPRVAEHRTR